MPHKRSAFVVLARRSDRHIYCVKGHKNDYGAPGGKGESTDRDDFTIAAREFEEETGHTLPGAVRVDCQDGYIGYTTHGAKNFYDYVAYGDVHHNCAFFYKVVDDDTASTLTAGASPDPYNGETEVAWVDPRAVWPQLRIHIKKGVAMIQARAPAFLNFLRAREARGSPRNKHVRGRKDRGAPTPPWRERRLLSQTPDAPRAQDRDEPCVPKRSVPDQGSVAELFAAFAL